MALTVYRHDNSIFRTYSTFLCSCQPKHERNAFDTYFLQEDSADFYECLAELFNSEKHSVFTRDFDSIHMVLDTSAIYYYGIDAETLTPKISELNYSQSEKRYLLSSETENGYIKRFVRELEKNHSICEMPDNRQEDLQGFRPFMSSAVSWYCWLCPFR